MLIFGKKGVAGKAVGVRSGDYPSSTNNCYRSYNARYLRGWWLQGKFFTIYIGFIAVPLVYLQHTAIGHTMGARAVGESLLERDVRGDLNIGDHIYCDEI